MATSITPAQAMANFKEVYGDEFLVASPMEKELQETFPFKEADKPGEAYSQGIRMTEEQGFTFRKAGQPASRMNDPIALKVEKASVLGDVLEFRSRIDVETMKRALSSKQAFKEHVGLRMEAMRDSCVKHVEWTNLQGGRPVAVISAIAGSGATRTLTIDPKSWAGGFWAGSENMPLDIYDSTSATLSGSAVKRNTSAGTAKYSVTGYDLDAKTLTLTADNSADWTGVVAGDCLWRFGSYLNESPGLVAITANQAAVINGINAGQYPMWRGVVDNAGGQLSMARLLQMSAKIASRSNTKNIFRVRTSPIQFAVLNSDLSAARRYDGSFSRTKGTNGYGAIEFYAPNGVLQITVHNHMKDGEVHINNDARTSRRGVSDIDFSMPGNAGGEYFLVVPDYNSFEYRAFSQQAMFHTAPAQSGLFTGLTLPA